MEEDCSGSMFNDEKGEGSPPSCSFILLLLLLLSLSLLLLLFVAIWLVLCTTCARQEQHSFTPVFLFLTKGVLQFNTGHTSPTTYPSDKRKGHLIASWLLTQSPTFQQETRNFTDSIIPITFCRTSTAVVVVVATVVCGFQTTRHFSNNSSRIFLSCLAFY